MTGRDTPTRRDRIIGSVLAAAAGDAAGAPHEGGMLERSVWRLIGRTRDGRRRWTDDTQMSVDTARSMLDCGEVNSDNLAREYAASIRWSRGYGPAATRTLRRIRRGTPWSVANRAVHPDGSWGNGAAMRAHIIAVAHGPDAALEHLDGDVERMAIVTHAHPLGVEGARAIARMVHAMLAGHGPADGLDLALAGTTPDGLEPRLRLVRTWSETGAQPGIQDVRSRLGHGMTALTSVATAIWLAVSSADDGFDVLVARAVALRGDVDTIASMAGGIWGAHRGAGALPREAVTATEASEDLRQLAGELADRFSGAPA